VLKGAVNTKVNTSAERGQKTEKLICVPERGSKHRS